MKFINEYPSVVKRCKKQQGKSSFYKKRVPENSEINTENKFPKDCFPKDQLSANDLLPQDANSKWAQVNPAGQGSVGDQNFLNAGYHVGVSENIAPLRNANLHLRSEEPNPRANVGPWQQSTIEPDTMRKAIF